MFMAGFGILLASIVATAPAEEGPRAVDSRLKITQFAAEPAIVTPTALTVDGAGRVFVIENHTHFRPKDYQGPPADRIRIFEDTDGDGHADRVRTFFEGTQMTMGLGFHPDGSLIVATRMEVFRLIDEDHDGAVDKREQLARLETKGDYPHNGLSGFAFDALGNICFGLGENLGASYKLVGRDGTTLSGGGEGGNIYTCRPDGTALRTVATGFWNPFHMGFDAFGRLFAVDNDPDSRPPCRLLQIVDGGDYGYRFRNGRKGLHPFTAWNGELPGTLPMVAGTGEAPSGIVAYESDHLPEDYRGNLIVTSWGDHRIERYQLADAAATIKSVSVPIVAGGENFRPVGIATAPDGSLYVSDWVDKSYPLHGKGRIWHITNSVAEPRVPPAHDRAALAHPDRRIREGAARALADSGEAGRRILRAALTESPDERARAVALEALVRAGDADDGTLAKAIHDRSPHVRAMAVRRLPLAQDELKSIAASDSSTAVQGEALRRIANPSGLAVLLAALQRNDPFLAQAAREGMKRSLSLDDLLKFSESGPHAVRLAAVLILREGNDPKARSVLGKLLTDPDLELRFAAIQWVSDERLDAYRGQLMEGLASGAATRNLFEGYLAALERLDGVERRPDQEFAGEDYVARLLDQSTTGPAVLRRALRMLRPDHPVLTMNRLKGYLESSDPGVRLEAIRTLCESRLSGRFTRLAGVADDRSQPPLHRAEAVVGLAEGGDKERDTLVELAGDAEPCVAREALRSLQGMSLSETQRRALADVAVKKERLRPLVARVLEAPRSATAEPSARDVAAWLGKMDGPSDPAEGERIFFQSKGPACSRCHQVDGRGGRVGPDLSTTGQTLTVERLVESIVKPSQEVAPQFLNWQVECVDGRVLSGVLVEETALGDQTYADSQGKLTTLKLGEVKSRQPQSASLMPDDLINSLTDQEFRNLIAYLRHPRPDP